MKTGDDKSEPVTEKELAEAFVKEYEALCQKHGFNIVVTPAWRVSQDTGDWRLILQSSVGKLPRT